MGPTSRNDGLAGPPLAASHDAMQAAGLHSGDDTRQGRGQLRRAASGSPGEPFEATPAKRARVSGDDGNEAKDGNVPLPPIRTLEERDRRRISFPAEAFSSTSDEDGSKNVSGTFAANHEANTERLTKPLPSSHSPLTSSNTSNRLVPAYYTGESVPYPYAHSYANYGNTRSSSSTYPPALSSATPHPRTPQSNATVPLSCESLSMPSYNSASIASTPSQPMDYRSSGSLYSQTGADLSNVYPSGSGHQADHSLTASSELSHQNKLPPAAAATTTPWTQSEAGSQRRRGKLPQATTAILRSWLLAHTGHPYPTEEEKKMLCEQTNLTMNQVSNWFINARRRILVPPTGANATHEIRQPARRQAQSQLARAAAEAGVTVPGLEYGVSTSHGAPFVALTGAPPPLSHSSFDFRFSPHTSSAQHTSNRPPAANYPPNWNSVPRASSHPHPGTNYTYANATPYAAYPAGSPAAMGGPYRPNAYGQSANYQPYPAPSYGPPAGYGEEK